MTDSSTLAEGALRRLHAAGVAEHTEPGVPAAGALPLAVNLWVPAMSGPVVAVTVYDEVKDDPQPDRTDLLNAAWSMQVRVVAGVGDVSRIAEEARRALETDGPADWGEDRVSRCRRLNFSAPTVSETVAERFDNYEVIAGR